MDTPSSKEARVAESRSMEQQWKRKLYISTTSLPDTKTAVVLYIFSLLVVHVCICKYSQSSQFTVLYLWMCPIITLICNPLKFNYNPKINTWGTLAVIHGHVHLQNDEKLESLVVQIPKSSKAIYCVFSIGVQVGISSLIRIVVSC